MASVGRSNQNNVCHKHFPVVNGICQLTRPDMADLSPIKCVCPISIICWILLSISSLIHFSSWITLSSNNVWVMMNSLTNYQPLYPTKMWVHIWIWTSNWSQFPTRSSYQKFKSLSEADIYTYEQTDMRNCIIYLTWCRYNWKLLN